MRASQPEPSGRHVQYPSSLTAQRRDQPPARDSPVVEWRGVATTSAWVQLSWSLWMPLAIQMISSPRQALVEHHLLRAACPAWLATAQVIPAGVPLALQMRINHAEAIARVPRPMMMELMVRPAGFSNSS